jgi:hypothetical protein
MNTIQGEYENLGPFQPGTVPPLPTPDDTARRMGFPSLAALHEAGMTRAPGTWDARLSGGAFREAMVGGASTDPAPVEPDPDPLPDPTPIPNPITRQSIVWGGFLGATGQPRLLDPQWQRPGATAVLIKELNRLYAAGCRSFMLHMPQGHDGSQLYSAKVWTGMPKWQRQELQNHLARWLRERPDFEMGVYGGTPTGMREFNAEYGKWAHLGVRMFGFDYCEMKRGYTLAAEVRDNWPGTRVIGEAIPVNADKTIRAETANGSVEWAALADWCETDTAGPVPANAKVHVIFQGHHDKGKVAGFVGRGMVADLWWNLLPWVP